MLAIEEVDKPRSQHPHAQLQLSRRTMALAVRVQQMAVKHYRLSLAFQASLAMSLHLEVKDLQARQAYSEVRRVRE